MGYEEQVVGFYQFATKAEYDRVCKKLIEDFNSLIDYINKNVRTTKREDILWFGKWNSWMCASRVVTDTKMMKDIKYGSQLVWDATDENGETIEWIIRNDIKKIRKNSKVLDNKKLVERMFYMRDMNCKSIEFDSTNRTIYFETEEGKHAWEYCLNQAMMKNLMTILKNAKWSKSKNDGGYCIEYYRGEENIKRAYGNRGIAKKNAHKNYFSL